MNNVHAIFQAGARLGLFAALALALLSLLYAGLQPRMESQRREALLQHFRDLAPEDDFSADFFQPGLCGQLDGHALRYDRSQQGNWFVRSSTFRGYSGEIALLLAISADGQRLLGVRVLEHRETAGLGDKIERRKSAWIESFRQRERSTRFELKRDGGEFDAFSGATITPRAVVRHVGALFPAWARREALPCPESP